MYNPSIPTKSRTLVWNGYIMGRLIAGTPCMHKYLLRKKRDETQIDKSLNPFKIFLVKFMVYEKI